MKIWIDNDGCPKIVRELVYAGAVRKKVEVMVVANTYSQVPLGGLFKAICVSGGFDAADDYIAENIAGGDLVITSDVPLAGRIVAKGAVGINSHGAIFDRLSIGDQLATRNLLQELRGGGLVSGGPPPFGPADKKKFADSFDRILEKMSK